MFKPILSVSDLEAELKINTNSSPLKRLLIHSCCAPCSTYVIEKLRPFFEITILYYNPNIEDFNEYQKRLSEQVKLIKILNEDVNLPKINLIELNYNVEEYLEAIKGFEDYKEKSIRCYHCYEFRLKLTASFAKKNNFDYFTTTISISPHKNSTWINEIGLKYGQANDITFLYSDFKKNNGYQKSIILSKKYNIYRQDYCGCQMSLYNSKHHNNQE